MAEVTGMTPAKIETLLEEIKWNREFASNNISHIDDLPDGWSVLTSTTAAQKIGIQEAPIVISKYTAGGYGLIRATSWKSPSRSWVSSKSTTGWGIWRKQDWGATDQIQPEWSSLDMVPDGVYFVDSRDEQAQLGLPASHGTLEVYTAKPYGLATFTDWSETGRRWVSERQTIGWRDWKPERLKLVDLETNTQNVIEVDHHGTGYGLDIQNYPGSDAALVLHNYTGDGEALIIDNCDNQVAVQISNTINTSITPNNIAKGDFFHLAPWSDIQRKVWKAKLTNDLTLKNDTEHPLSLQRVDEALVGRRDQDDIVLQIKNKAGDVTASIHSDGRVSDRYTRQGIGSPEGEVEAPVGTIYTDTAATNGAIRWIKSSGTGNTGWAVEYGDTGWRDVKPASYTGSLDVRRVGEMVMVRLGSLAPPGDVVLPTVVNLTVGFQSAGRVIGAISRLNSLGTQGRLWIEGGLVRVVPGTGSKIDDPFTPSHQYTGIVIYPTNNPWPTALPGTPA